MERCEQILEPSFHEPVRADELGPLPVYLVGVGRCVSRSLQIPEQGHEERQQLDTDTPRPECGRASTGPRLCVFVKGVQEVAKIAETPVPLQAAEKWAA